MATTATSSQATTDPWSAFAAELDAWAAEGRTADFWWRDDDAARPGPKLDRLLDVTGAAGTGLLLAVIPADAADALGPAIAGAEHVRVAQHGYAHISHAPKGQGLGAWELGLHRGETAVFADLDRGRARLDALFRDRFLPVVVPPWNRIDPALFPGLAARGYVGVSAFGPRDAALDVAGLVQSNAHCDPIRWKDGARFAGADKALGDIVRHLEARRAGTADPGEPTGFLTHHIDLDEPGWGFCAAVAGAVAGHPAARWIAPETVFRGPT